MQPTLSRRLEMRPEKHFQTGEKEDRNPGDENEEELVVPPRSIRIGRRNIYEPLSKVRMRELRVRDNANETQGESTSRYSYNPNKAQSSRYSC